MSTTPSLGPIRVIKISQDIESINGFKDIYREDIDHEQPLSPTSRLFHEPGVDVYIIVVIGMKTSINVELFTLYMQALKDSQYRFSCLQVLNKENGSMTWVPINADINDHVVVPELDPNMESSDKFVEDYVSQLSRSRIESSKALWDVHILNTRTSDANGTCIFRFHHSIGDGISLMNLVLAFSHKVSNPEEVPTLKGVSPHRIQITCFRSLLMILWNSILALVMFMLTALFLKDTTTPIKGNLGTEDKPRRFVHQIVSFEDIKSVKKAMNVTVNDVILGVVQCGLYRYLKRRYGLTENDNTIFESIRLRAALFFNLRATTRVDPFGDTSKHGTWGNEIGYVLLPFNIKYRKDILDHVREAKASMERKKASLEPYCSSFLAKLAIKLFGVKVSGKLNYNVLSNVTLGYSNLPGPQEEVILFGHEVAYIAPSCYGQPMALTIHAVSYVDKVTFMISVDEEIIPDPRKLCDDIQQSLYLMKSSVA